MYVGNQKYRVQLGGSKFPCKGCVRLIYLQILYISENVHIHVHNFAYAIMVLCRPFTLYASDTPSLMAQQPPVGRDGYKQPTSSAVQFGRPRTPR